MFRIQELQNEVAQLKLDLERAQAGIKHLNNQVHLSVFNIYFI